MSPTPLDMDFHSYITRHHPKFKQLLEAYNIRGQTCDIADEFALMYEEHMIAKPELKQTSQETNEHLEH